MKKHIFASCSFMLATAKLRSTTNASSPFITFVTSQHASLNDQIKRTASFEPGQQEKVLTFHRHQLKQDEASNDLNRKHVSNVVKLSFSKEEDEGGHCIDDEIDDSDDDGFFDDNDEVEETAYKNRSLSWTKKFRTLIPYHRARRSAMRLGLRSQAEWEELGSYGPYLPSNPQKMYPDEWTSWEDFLGVVLTYDEARALVQSVLKLRNKEEYEWFVRSDPKRAEGLRMPLKPEVVYADGKGWIGEEHFFGVSDDLSFQ